MAKDSNDKPMSIGEHLEELRKRVFLSIVGILPIFGAGLYFGRKILQFLILPLDNALKEKHIAGGAMQATQLLEGFITYIKIAAVLAAVVGGPWIIYQIWKFIAPGLYARERRFFYILSPMSIVFSALGVAFMYYVMLPFVLVFFVSFNETLLTRPATPQVEMSPNIRLPTLPWFAGDPTDRHVGDMWINTERDAIRIALPDPAIRDQTAAAKESPILLSLPLHSDSYVVQQYKIAEYVGLVLTFAFAFALTFQTPVVVLLLGWIGLIDPNTVGKYRKYAILVCTIVSAIITPPDALSMLSLGVPMYLLFELGVILLRIMPAKKVASGRFFSTGVESRDGEGGGDGSDDPSARPDHR